MSQEMASRKRIEKGLPRIDDGDWSLSHRSVVNDHYHEWSSIWRFYARWDNHHSLGAGITFFMWTRDGWS